MNPAREVTATVRLEGSLYGRHAPVRLLYEGGCSSQRAPASRGGWGVPGWVAETG